MNKTLKEQKDRITELKNAIEDAIECLSFKSLRENEEYVDDVIRDLMKELAK